MQTCHKASYFTFKLGLIAEIPYSNPGISVILPLFCCFSILLLAIILTEFITIF